MIGFTQPCISDVITRIAPLWSRKGNNEVLLDITHCSEILKTGFEETLRQPQIALGSGGLSNSQRREHWTKPIILVIYFTKTVGK